MQLVAFPVVVLSVTLSNTNVEFDLRKASKVYSVTT